MVFEKLENICNLTKDLQVEVQKLEQNILTSVHAKTKEALSNAVLQMVYQRTVDNSTKIRQMTKIETATTMKESVAILENNVDELDIALRTLHSCIRYAESHCIAVRLYTLAEIVAKQAETLMDKSYDNDDIGLIEIIEDIESHILEIQKTIENIQKTLKIEF